MWPEIDVGSSAMRGVSARSRPALSLLLWLLAATAATGLFFLVLRSEHGAPAHRWRSFDAERGGSARRGKLLFQERGCSNCHGRQGQGSDAAPALRVRDTGFTAARLAAGFWGHAATLQRHALEQRLQWSTLAAEDVGDLVAFLNSPPEER